MLTQVGKKSGAADRAADEEDNTMENVWKYKIELKDSEAFSKVEKLRGIHIPEELKNFIKEHNAAQPSKYHFMVDSIERVFGAVLSFDEEEKEADKVYPALEAIGNKNLLPFAVDPFGNFICYALDKNEVVFWDHETEDVTSTGKNLEQFIENLY